MSRRFWLFAMAFLCACSSGGGGSSLSETLNWPAFRRDPFNSGLGGANIDKNNGQIRFETTLQAPEGALTLPVPAIGKKLTIYIGTADGLAALDKEGVELFRFQYCNLEDGTVPCDTPSDTCIEVGPVNSTPAANSKGDLIVSSVRGYVFWIHDESVEKKALDQFTCRWAFPPPLPSTSPVLSSPQVILEGNDEAFTSVFIGTNSGWLQALNINGTEKWRFPADSDSFGPLTGTVALSASRTLHFVAPDGVLYSIDTTGRFLWSAPVGVDTGPDALRLLPSPSVNVSVYAIGAGGSIFAYNPNGTRKWQFQTKNRVLGSTSFLNQFVNELVDGDEETRLETVVRVVDETGVLYGILDRNGRELDTRLCTETTDVTCSSISDCSGEETCDLISECTGTDDRCITDDDCTSEQTCDSTGMMLCSGTDRNRSCFFDGDCAAQETCILIRRCSLSRERCVDDSDCPTGQICESSVHITTESPILPVSSSPALSTDLYAVVGSDDGRLCARRLDEIVPEDDVWETGCITIAPGKALSSPIIDLDGTIYVASDETLYAIGTP